MTRAELCEAVSEALGAAPYLRAALILKAVDRYSTLRARAAYDRGHADSQGTMRRVGERYWITPEGEAALARYDTYQAQQAAGGQR